VEVAVVFTRSRFTLSERGTAPMLPTTRLRIKEEHRAAEIAGYRATFLPFAESYGRPGLSTPREILDPRRDPRNDPVWPGVREAVRELVRDHRGPVLAPLGCTSHIDHRIVSLAARELPEEDPGRELAFYEDLPYAAFLPREILESLVPTHPSGDPYERFPLRGGSLESKIALLRSYPSQMNGGILDQVRLHWEGTGGENLWRRRQG
jgi:LmbE family N-acetylglucosaminyl deacetylase